MPHNEQQTTTKLNSLGLDAFVEDLLTNVNLAVNDYTRITNSNDTTPYLLFVTKYVADKLKNHLDVGDHIKEIIKQSVTEPGKHIVSAVPNTNLVYSVEIKRPASRVDMKEFKLALIRNGVPESAINKAEADATKYNSPAVSVAAIFDESR